MVQIFNFSSGPAMLPTDVLKQAQKELCDWNNFGTSVMEISHREKAFIQIIEEAKKDLRDLLNIPKNYKILFCHGGGRGQFSALPLNLLGNKTKADYVNTGYWALHALKEGKKYCTVNTIDVKVTFSSNGKLGIKPMNEWNLSYDSAYVHYCPNETIDGIAIYEMPNFGDDIIVAADFSSSILSSPLDINRFGIIYASSQKNIGPAGIALIIIREDLLGKSSKRCPSILDYTILNKKNSMFNTPPTFSLYLAGLVFKWLKKKGGIMLIDAINRKKAKLLYSIIDRSDLYYNNVIQTNRSHVNIPFYLKNKSLDKLFLKESFSVGLRALNGHRTAGGMRASIYNAMPFSGVKSLADFMVDFERRHC